MRKITLRWFFDPYPLAMFTIETWTYRFFIPDAFGINVRQWEFLGGFLSSRYILFDIFTSVTLYNEHAPNKQYSNVYFNRLYS